MFQDTCVIWNRRPLQYLYLVEGTPFSDRGRLQLVGRVSAQSSTVQGSGRLLYTVRAKVLSSGRPARTGAPCAPRTSSETTYLIRYTFVSKPAGCGSL